MASELKVDKFTGVTTAGSILVTGEGNSTTTNLQQGLCKMWARLNGQGTIALDDSFNVGSTTDEGTGQYTYTFSNNMSNANFNVAHASGNQMQIHSLSATSSVRTLNRDGSNNNEDANPAFSNVHGDLA
jgi:hypothetical protein